MKTTILILSMIAVLTCCKKEEKIPTYCFDKQYFIPWDSVSAFTSFKYVGINTCTTLYLVGGYVYNASIVYKTYRKVDTVLVISPLQNDLRTGIYGGGYGWGTSELVFTREKLSQALNN
jgi:hypothetical protein